MLALGQVAAGVRGDPDQGEMVTVQPGGGGADAAGTGVDMLAPGACDRSPRGRTIRQRHFEIGAEIERGAQSGARTARLLQLPAG